MDLAKGLKQLGITDAKKILSAPLCLNSQVAAGLGGDFPIWTYAIASSLYGDRTDPGMPAYEKVTDAVRQTAKAPDPWNIVVVRADADHGAVPEPARLRQHHARRRCWPRPRRSPGRSRSARRRFSAASTRARRRCATTGRSSSCTRESTCSSKSAGWLQPPS